MVPLLATLVLLSTRGQAFAPSTATATSTTRLHQYDQLAQEWAVMNRNVDDTIEIFPAAPAPIVPASSSPAPQQQQQKQPMRDLRDDRSAYQHNTPQMGTPINPESYMNDFRSWALEAISSAEKSTGGAWWDNAGQALGYSAPADHLTSDRVLGKAPAQFNWDLQSMRNVLNEPDFAPDLDEMATNAMRGQREPWVVDQVTKSGMTVSTRVHPDEGIPANRVSIRIPFRSAVRNFGELRQAVLDLFDTPAQGNGGIPPPSMM